MHSRFLAATALVASLAASGAMAQAIERNLPPAPPAAGSDIAPPNIVAASADATPIGPALTSLVILGPKDAVVAAPLKGVDVLRDPALAKDSRRLARFLGKPISRKLIGEIEAQIAIAYRDRGYPFVNLSTPPQELTGGALQIRVVEFRLGTVTPLGAKGRDGAYEESRIRLKPGEEINTNTLAQDLDWLDRYPFRNAQAVFSPSKTPGATDLQLQTTYTKPWSIYAGYANSGSSLTGFDRYILGAETTVPFLKDSLVSYQFTGSDNALFNHNGFFNAASPPTYLSHAGRLVVPTLARQDVELTVDYVQTFEPLATRGYDTRLNTLEATLAYRAALSDFVSFLPGEGVAGFEAKNELSHTLFGGVNVPETEHNLDVFQAIVGWTYLGNDPLGRTTADITVHVSPGGLGSKNTKAAFTGFSNDRFDVDTYAYVSGDLTRYDRLPPLFGIKGFSLVTTLIGQYSAIPLPLTEQAGVGGQSLVRGYTLDDGAFDTAIVSRNELHLPPIVLPLPGSVAAPYVFVDNAIGKSNFTKKTEQPASTGVAMDIQLTKHVAATIDGAFALRNAGLTHTGDGRFDIHVTVTY
jgi:hemolysin activation/secretion protein